MPSDEMIEKVARAIDPDAFSYTSDVDGSLVAILRRDNAMKAAQRALAAAEAGEPVYRYQTPDYRSFSQTTRPVTPEQNAIERSFASPPSEASRDERAAIRKEAFEEAAKVAEEYARQNRDGASKARARAAKISRIGDVFGHGEMADTAAMELDACGNEAEAIATAIRARGET